MCPRNFPLVCSSHLLNLVLVLFTFANICLLHLVHCERGFSNLLQFCNLLFVPLCSHFCILLLLWSRAVLNLVLVAMTTHSYTLGSYAEFRCSDLFDHCCMFICCPKSSALLKRIIRLKSSDLLQSVDVLNLLVVAKSVILAFRVSILKWGALL
jgi:hypothetical protein